MTPVNLRAYDNSWYDPGRGAAWRTAWHIAGHLLLHSRWITSSAFRVSLLRFFGAVIGERVVMRHPVRVKYPWHLTVGDDCWFGEDCWIDNLTSVTVGSNVCISQGAFLCTGNHDWSDPQFGLVVRPITLRDASWAGARCIIAPGVTLGTGSVAAAGSVITANVPDFEVHAGNPACFVKQRKVRSLVELHDASEVLS